MEEEDKPSKIVMSLVVASFGIVLALPFITTLPKPIDPLTVFKFFVASCSLSFLIYYFFPNLYLKILGLFRHIG